MKWSRVQIEPALLSEEREVLEDLIAAAINDATHKVACRGRTRKWPAPWRGLQLPPGMKLPF